MEGFYWEERVSAGLFCLLPEEGFLIVSKVGHVAVLLRMMMIMKMMKMMR